MHVRTYVYVYVHSSIITIHVHDITHVYVFTLVMMRRQKRKPDSIQLNFVESLPKRRSVQIKRVTYPLSKPAASQEAGTKALAFSSASIVTDTAACDTPPDDFPPQEHFLSEYHLSQTKCIVIPIQRERRRLREHGPRYDQNFFQP